VPIISRGLDYRLGPTRMAIVFQKDIPYKIPGPELPIGPTIKIQRVSLSLQKKGVSFFIIQRPRKQGILALKIRPTKK